MKGLHVLLHASILLTAHAQNCQLIVPATPFTAAGLMTPYIQSTMAGSAVPCSTLTPMATSFVEATIFDTVTNKLSVYNPLVVDATGGGTVAAGSTMSKAVITANSVVGIWFGANGNTVLTIAPAAGTTLVANNCVNGDGVAVFGQFSYCNAVAFFKAVNAAIQAGTLTIPPVGTTFLGAPCPTTHSFSLVDQDQSDNMVTTYIVTTNMQVAQNSLANLKALNVLTIVGNGSDNRLLDMFYYPALGCTPFMAPDNAEPTVMRSSLALNELSAVATAAANPGTIQAFVPSGDPMVLSNNAASLQKLNLYRMGVNQPVLTALNSPQDTTAYCNNLAATAGPFLLLHANLLKLQQSPDPMVGSNLYNFIASRFAATWTNLNCQVLTGTPTPITVNLDANNVAIDNNIATAYGPTGANAFFSQAVPVTYIIYAAIFVVLALVVLNILFVRFPAAKKAAGFSKV